VPQRIPGPGYHFVIENGVDRVELSDGVTMPRRVTVIPVAGDDLPRTEVVVETGDDGVPRCRAVRVTSGEAGRDVQASDLRGLPLEDVIVAAVKYTGTTATGTALGGWGGLDEMRQRVQATTAAAKQARRGVRRRVTPELLRRVAEVYRANPDAPTKAVAEVFGVAHRTGTLYVRQARDADLLPPVEPKRGKS
jgi:hypothetical protein